MLGLHLHVAGRMSFCHVASSHHGLCAVCCGLRPSTQALLAHSWPLCCEPGSIPAGGALLLFSGLGAAGKDGARNVSCAVYSVSQVQQCGQPEGPEGNGHLAKKRCQMAVVQITKTNPNKSHSQPNLPISAICDGCTLVCPGP